jgi:hypothetical protein
MYSSPHCAVLGRTVGHSIKSQRATTGENNSAATTESFVGEAMSSSSVYTFAIYQYGFPAMPRGFTFCVPIRDRHAPVAPFSPGRRIYFSGIDPKRPVVNGGWRSSRLACSPRQFRAQIGSAPTHVGKRQKQSHRHILSASSNSVCGNMAEPNLSYRC